MDDLTEMQREAAHQRQELAQSIDALSAAVNPTNLRDQAATLANEYGGDLGRQAWGAARQNPAAFALVGAGLGLLMLGTGSRAETHAPKPVAAPPSDALMGFDERVAAADAAMANAADKNDAPRAKWMREKLDAGLESLSPNARIKVRKAREAALDAQEKVERQAEQIARKSKTFMHDQPLAVGAVALGIGALVGALLPSTRREDALLGERRDELMATARNALSAEVDNARAAVSDTLASASKR